jgi:hypothetical protein
MQAILSAYNYKLFLDFLPLNLHICAFENESKSTRRNAAL